MVIMFYLVHTQYLRNMIVTACLPNRGERQYSAFVHSWKYGPKSRQLQPTSYHARSFVTTRIHLSLSGLSSPSLWSPKALFTVTAGITAFHGRYEWHQSNIRYLCYNSILVCQHPSPRWLLRQRRPPLHHLDRLFFYFVYLLTPTPRYMYSLYLSIMYHNKHTNVSLFFFHDSISGSSRWDT